MTHKRTKRHSIKSVSLKIFLSFVLLLERRKILAIVITPLLRWLYLYCWTDVMFVIFRLSVLLSTREWILGDNSAYTFQLLPASTFLMNKLNWTARNSFWGVFCTFFLKSRWQFDKKTFVAWIQRSENNFMTF